METQTTTQNPAQVIEVKHLLNKFRKDIDKQLEYLTNMAKRLKLTPPTWTIGEVYDYEFEVMTGKENNGEGMEEVYETFIEPVFDITLSVKDTLQIDGDWMFACAIDHRAKAMIQVDESIEIPVQYSPSNDACEHCGKKYPRVQSFIVFSPKTGEFKQVGKGCLKQFLGINPASYITMFEAVSKFSPMVRRFGKNYEGSGRMDNLAYDVAEMLRYAIHQVAKDGKFVKVAWEDKEIGQDWRGNTQYRKVIANPTEATICKVRERLQAISFFRLYPSLRNDSTTVSQLNDLMKRYEKRITLFEGVDFKSNENEKASARYGEIGYAVNRTRQHIQAVAMKDLLDEEIMSYTEEIASMKAFVEGLKIETTPLDGGEVILSGFDQYKQKLKTVFLKDRTLQSNLGTLVSGWGFYLTQKERAEAERIRLANAVNLAFVGVVGEKSELKLKVTDYKSGEGQYGTWELWFMEDEAGNKFKKFGTLSENHIIEIAPDRNADEMVVMVGDTIQVIAEIKAHETYREEKQTTLGRMSKVKKAKYLYSKKTTI